MQGEGTWQEASGTAPKPVTPFYPRPLAPSSVSLSWVAQA